MTNKKSEIIISFMFYLITAILLAVITANLMKLSAHPYFLKKFKINTFTVFLANYFLASIFSFFLAKINKNVNLEINELYLGIIAGTLFLANFFLYIKNIEINGMSLSVGIMRISVIIPVLVSILLFHENISFVKIIAILFMLVSFSLFIKNKSKFNLFWIIILFLCTGFTDTTMKIYDFYLGKTPDMFLFYTFFSAFILNAFILVIKKIKPDIISLLFGFLLGIPNQLTSFFFIKSLKVLPAVKVYPTFASGIVLFTVISDILIWKAKFTKREFFAFLLLLIGIIFINLR